MSSSLNSVRCTRSIPHPPSRGRGFPEYALVSEHTFAIYYILTGYMCLIQTFSHLQSAAAVAATEMVSVVDQAYDEKNIRRCDG